MLAVAYTAGLPAFLLAIRHSGFEQRSWAGAWLVFFPLVVTWICDTAAMFGGTPEIVIAVLAGTCLAVQLATP